MMQIIAVATGGAIGAVLRYLTGLAAIRLFNKPKVYTGTLIANVSGCFMVGAVLATLTITDRISEPVLLFFTVGILGSYTTFSTFALETGMLLKGPIHKLALYLSWQIAGAFLAFIAGYELVIFLDGAIG